jgi:hypothetical protein
MEAMPCIGLSHSPSLFLLVAGHPFINEQKFPIQSGVLSSLCEPDETITLTAEVKPQAEPELFQVSLNASSITKGSHSSAIKATLTRPDGEVHQQSIPVLVNVR